MIRCDFSTLHYRMIFSTALMQFQVFDDSQQTTRVFYTEMYPLETLVVGFFPCFSHKFASIIIYEPFFTCELACKSQFAQFSHRMSSKIDSFFSNFSSYQFSPHFFFSHSFIPIWSRFRLLSSILFGNNPYDEYFSVECLRGQGEKRGVIDSNTQYLVLLCSFA